MQICSYHFAELDEALRKRNLWRFVHSDRAGMREAMKTWLSGKGVTRENFDPRVIAGLEFQQKVVTLLGDGFLCPLCRCRAAYGSDMPGKWMGQCLDQLAEIAATVEPIIYATH
jgi:hypothetical protein